MRAAMVCLLMSILGMATSPAVPASGSGFVENRGQIDPAVSYYALGSRMAVFFTRDAAVFDLRKAIPAEERSAADPWPSSGRPAEPGRDRHRGGCAVYMRFEGGNACPVIEAGMQIETRFNYFLGNDPSLWRTEVPAYREVVYRDAWPGVDLVFSDDGGRLVYELRVSPGSDPATARFRYEGAIAVDLSETGSTLIETEAGTLIQHPAVPGRHAGYLEVGKTEADSPYGADPAQERNDASVLVWSTFLGGGLEDGARALARDSSGDLIFNGVTWSPDFPTTPGAYDVSYHENDDIFIAKLSGTGSNLIWSTFLGGSWSERSFALVLDSAGNPVITGMAGPDFPSTPGTYDPSFNGDYDVFVTKLSSTGSSLLWSTFLGGNGHECAYELVLDSSENPVLAGTTDSWSTFPVTPGTYDASSNGDDDIFVAKVSSTGSTLLWSTFLGGYGEDRPDALALDPSDNPVLSGITTSSNFPTTPGAYDTSRGGTQDAFVAKLSSTGSILLWSTYLGGRYTDSASDLILDPLGNPIVTGYTSSSDFPTTPGAYDTSWNSALDAFVCKLSATGSAVLWSTFLGGSSHDIAGALVPDPAGNLLLTGYTYSSDFPTTPGAYDTSWNGRHDVFVTWLSRTGSTILWSTLLGGSQLDYGHALILDPSGDLIVTGRTESPDFPSTPAVYDPSWNGDYDAFAARLSMPNLMAIETAPSDCEAPVVLHLAANPALERVSLEYTLASREQVTFEIFDIHGRALVERESELQAAGPHSIDWDGRDACGQPVASGVYFARLRAGASTAGTRFVLLRAQSSR